MILLENTGWLALTLHGVSPEKNQIGAEAEMALSRREHAHIVTQDKGRNSQSHTLAQDWGTSCGAMLPTSLNFRISQIERCRHCSYHRVFPTSVRSSKGYHRTTDVVHSLCKSWVMT